MLCLTPYSARNCRKVLSMKCDPSSLMTIRGVPNRGNITSWNIFFGVLGVSGPTWQCFYPLGHIVHRHQDVFCISRLWEWSHEIDPPNVKQLHLEVVHEWHCILSVDVSMLLASDTSSNKLFCNTSLARRIRSARSWRVYGMLHSVLHRVMCDISL